jgi:hypothetical protein
LRAITSAWWTRRSIIAAATELVVELGGVVGLGEPVDPWGGGGELDPVAGLAGADREPGGQIGLLGAGRAEEHDVLLGGDEVHGAQVSDGLPFQAAGVVVVEVLQGLAGREPGGADPTFAAVGLPGGDLASQAREPFGALVNGRSSTQQD